MNRRVIAVAVLLPIIAGCATFDAKKNAPQDWRAGMQPPLSDEQVRHIGEGLNLAEAVKLGAERNTGVEAARSRWLAAINVEPQAVTPGDPKPQFQAPFQKMISLMGRQQWMLGLMQDIPWPQKLWARGRTAATEADIAELRYEAAVRDLIVDVKDSFYELFYLDQALPITEQIEQMLRNDAILAYSELAVGKTQISEAFRAESQAAQLGYDRILLTELRTAQAERLKALLNLPPETVVGPIKQAPVYPVAPSVTELYDLAEHYAEILKIRGLETQKAGYDAFLAKLVWVPDFGLGADVTSYTKTKAMSSGGASSTTSSGTMTGGTSSGTGGSGATSPASSAPSNTPIGSNTDMVSGSFSMNLPIWWWRNQAIIREKKATEQAMRLDALDETNQVRASVARAYFQVELTGRLIRLYADTLLPQAEEVMRQAEALFRGDQASFSNVIETTLAYHNFTLASLRAQADHGQAIGRLEKVLGTTAESGPVFPKPGPDETGKAGQLTAPVLEKQGHSAEGASK